ncbi:hypothetical protein DY000_02012811 [Brassica cretica]|uniref:Uncharacterized protein n=1 Tax=Brassica cretica TaxID=69181 RepID=A0ABQ7D6J7_BRACR|nr:hypothetical protein DY000_02012811 [Brassica cretica]
MDLAKGCSSLHRTAVSTKMRIANALASPRKRAPTKTGSHCGENGKQQETTLQIYFGTLVIFGLSGGVFGNLWERWTSSSIGDALGRTVAVDIEHSRVQVVVNAFQELCFQTTLDFKGGEFYDGEEAEISLRYEKSSAIVKFARVSVIRRRSAL